MTLATMFAFLIASTVIVFSGDCARESENKTATGVAISVDPSSLSYLPASSPSAVPGTASSAFTELRVKPEEERLAATSAVGLGPKETALTGAMQQVSKAAAGMSAVGDDSRALRKAVADLALESGLEDSDRKAAALAKQRLQAQANLREVARELQGASQKAEVLDMNMKQAFARLVGTDVQSDVETEDAQLAKLEKETHHVMDLFRQVHALRAERDSVKAKKSHALQTARDLGLSQDEIKRVVGQAMDTQQLQDLMTTSANEMAQIVHAADDLTEGLDTLTELKYRQGGGSTLPNEGAAVEAKLTNAFRFLEEHEGLATERKSQIQALMGKTTG